MERDKIEEFLTVLIFGTVFGAAFYLVLEYLEGTAQYAAIFVLLGCVIAVWYYLRKRFGRDT